jgi:3-oxoacyl-[acyl-carrier-protein] synthase-3
MSIGFLGLGSYLPATVRSNDHWPKAVTGRRDFISVQRSSGEKVSLPPEIAAALAKLEADPYQGARLRHVIGDDQEPSDLEAEACRRAMRAASVTATDIDLVLVASPVPDRLLPSNGPAIQTKCGLLNASAWSLDLGCASLQPQLLAASAMIEQGMFAHALLAQSSAVTRVVNYDEPVSIAVGDGAAAAVVGRIPDGYGVIGHYSRTDGSLRDGVVHAPIVDGEPVARWDRAVGAVRLSSLDLVAGRESGRRGTEFCRDACDGALAAAGLTRDDVDLFVVNQSLGWFLEACRRAVGIGEDRVVDTFAEVGNLGPPSILFNLERAHRDGRLSDGDIVLCYSPGAGLTRTAIVYRWYPLRS